MNSFSEMSVEQLKNAVEQELHKPTPDRTTIMECLQELKRREPKETQDKVLKAWEASQQSKKRFANKVWRSIVAAAAVVVVVLLLTVPDVCGEENVIQLIGRWTDSIFSFSEIHEHEFVYQTDHPGLQELYDTVTALGVEKNVVPTWLPDGYQLEQLETQKRSDSITLFANFMDSKHQISFNIMVFTSIPNTEYQKGRDAVEVFEKNGIQHYIVGNDETWTAAWSIDNTECFISADTENNLKQILLSIYKSEGSL